MWITGTDSDDIMAIVKTLKAMFPGRAGPTSKDLEALDYTPDYAQILRFLSNRKLFEQIFEEVSADMEDMYRFRRETLNLRNSLTGAFHSLFRVLDAASKNAVGCAFPDSHEDIVILRDDKLKIQNVTLTGNARDLFGGIVSMGYLFKDETGPSHGEYAHTLQWLTIAYAKYYSVIKLQHGILALYRSAAGSGSLASKQFAKTRTLDADTDEPDQLQLPVWSLLVDCFRSSELHGQPEAFGENLFVENYRSPSYLTDQMLHRRLRQTWLGKHIQARYDKRGIKTGMKSRQGFRSSYLGKQKDKQDAFKLEGATTNALAPSRTQTETLITELNRRAGVT